MIGEVTLSSGQRASYYVDARRALLRPAGFRAAGELIAAAATEAGAEAVGGPVMAAIPLACAAIAVPGATGWSGFFVRKERKEHGLQRWVEGPVEAGRPLPRGRGHGDHRRLDRRRDRADPRARGSRSSAPCASSIASPAAPRRSPRPPAPRSGRWSRSTSSTRSAPTASLNGH